MTASRLTGRGTVWCAAALAMLVFARFPAVAHGETPPTCMTLLTTETVKKTVGLAMEDMGHEVRGEGETECAWMARGGPGGFSSLAVQFYDLRAIADSPNAPQLAGFFDAVVSSAEAVATGKHEALSGIGQRAAFVPTDPQMLVVVQRSDGVARIVANNLTKDQVTAVARAVAAP